MTHPTDIPTILIIDDTPANLSVLVDLFEDRGYRIAIAQDGEEGLQRVQWIQPDLILLDVMLPGENGFQICQHLKAQEKTRDIPVIFMTSLASTEHKVRGFAAGGVDYLTKPLQLDEVLARVDVHLKLHAAQRQLEVQNAQLEKHHEKLEQRVAERTDELRVHQIELEMQNHELRQAQLIIEESRDRYVDLYEFAPVAYLTLNRAGLIDEVNLTGATMFGVERKKLIKRRFSSFVTPEDNANWYSLFNATLQDGRQRCELALRRGVDVFFHAQLDCLHMKDGGVRIALTDITERKQAETLRVRLSRELKAIGVCNQIMFRAENEQFLLNEICRVVCDEAGYLMAWVGFAENDPARSVRPVAQSGYEEGYLEGVNVTWADTKWGQGPTGTAIRTGRTIINQDSLGSAAMSPWRDAVIKRGYRSSLALPLVVNKSVLGALTIYASEPHAFSCEEVILLEGLAQDITYGIKTLRTRAEHKQAEQVIEESRIQLRGLAAKNELMREEERKSIAREVHDELGQILTGLQLDVSLLSNKIGSDFPVLSEHIKGTLELVQQSLAVTRNVVSALRPASLDMGIEAAVEWLVSQFSKNTGINCKLHVHDEEMINLDEDSCVALFRITQEMLTNVAKHAQASKVDIGINLQGDDYLLEVRDNGIGFDSDTIQKGKYGLLGIRERVNLLEGKLLISSTPGSGTAIKVLIPAHHISGKK
jgi:PAS domain S-box-containing protein